MEQFFHCWLHIPCSSLASHLSVWHSLGWVSKEQTCQNQICLSDQPVELICTTTGSHEGWERERQAPPGALPAWSCPGLEEKLRCSYYEHFGPGVPGLMQKNIVACVFQPIRPGCFFIFHNYLINYFLLK